MVRLNFKKKYGTDMYGIFWQSTIWIYGIIFPYSEYAIYFAVIHVYEHMASASCS